MDRKLQGILSQGESGAYRSTAEARQVDNNFFPHFQQMIVLEVISDPKKITKEKVLYWKNVLKLGMSWSARYLTAPNIDDAKDFPRIFPRNAIIAQQKSSSETALTPPSLLLPFFPSHLSMPCKPGELVWVVYENPKIGGEKIGYWMCSVVQPYFVDDVNHTHAPMALRQPKKPANAPPDLEIPYQLRNGSISLGLKDGKYVDDRNDPIIVSDTTTRFISSIGGRAPGIQIFEDLITLTDASKLSSYEAIPRFHKRPGDVVLEGSNNSLIVLGTDRSGPPGIYSPSQEQTKSTVVDKGLSPSWPIEDFFSYAGSIDLVVGRGYTTETGGEKNIAVKEIANPQNTLKEEIDKLNPPIDEGDPRFDSDRSRILISQRTFPDTKFQLREYFQLDQTTPNVFDDLGSGDASVVIKSDKIRLIARSDISLVVTNFDESPEITRESRISHNYKIDSKDTSKFASITITREGDIIFRPSDLGIIKLGGADADKAILCTDNLEPGDKGKPKVDQGKVTFKPGIVSTGADLIGTGKPKQGTFATKILVK